MLNQTLNDRLAGLNQWLQSQLGRSASELKVTPLAGDASFRRYFRVCLDHETFVAMDAPPNKEDCRPFVAVAKVFSQQGLHVPQIFHADLTQGFMLIADLGDQLYFNILNASNANRLYRNAIKALLTIQSCPQNQGWHFPAFDALMLEELSLFRKWYLLEHLKLALTSAEETMLAQAFEKLVASGLEQPQVCTHRDYHSRNLMALANDNTGILDFQDAVWGPVTYDLVSLIRDCYIAWPRAQVEQWALDYYNQATAAKLLTAEAATFMRWLDWMGIQRHLKAIFIFARKFRRDQNANYLGDIPRTLQYVLDAAERYVEFAPLRNFLQERVLPYESDDFSRRTRATNAPAD